MKTTRTILLSLTFATAAIAGPCLTNPSDTIGNPIFAANVGTFTGLGVNPAVTCLENDLWSAPSGFILGSYLQGGSGFGTGVDNTVLGSYNGSGSLAANANGLDHAWVQDTGHFTVFPSGDVGGSPSAGIIWDLGGQANQAAVFAFVDHGPVPGEVLENSVWLGNDPNAVDGGWTQAFLTHVYGAGWAADPVVSDGFIAVYSLPNPALTFRYVSVTWGGPGAIIQDGDNEIDAVGGLINGSGVLSPEPGSVVLMLAGLAGIVTASRRRRA